LKIEKSFAYDLYQNLDELAENQRNLLLRAQANTHKSYAPYSRFYVGAALLLEGDVTIDGANQENASFPMCTCAETTAIVNAGVNHPQLKVLKLAVTVRSHKIIENPVSPCGKCRQQILEQEFRQNSDIEIILRGEKGPIYCFPSIKMLLPFYFDGSTLA
jgi:cytidine deaminase